MNLAVVVPRYGADIFGGAEILARTIAEHLARWHRVTVLTTTARDYVTWRDQLPPGEHVDGAVRVIRFPPERERGPYWHQLNHLLERHVGVSGEPASAPAALDGARLRMWPVALQEEYIRRQGPFPLQLFRWLGAHAADQDRVLFFTYLYPTSYFGIPCAPAERIDFYPLLHDEPPAHLPVFGSSFERAQRVLFCTETERRLAAALYGLRPQVGVVLGYGLAPPAQGVERRRDDTQPYLLYIGRVDPNKGVGSLLDHFQRWRAEHPRHALRLVLIGERTMELPEHPAIEYRGRVSEAEKSALLGGALALVNPSLFESLGLVILEAFLHGTPALVRARNAVLADHCRRSHGGLWYDDYAEFAAALAWLLEHSAAADALGAQGRAYAEAHYSRPAYEQRLAALYPPDGQ